jgi:hypothetical protein
MKNRQIGPLKLSENLHPCIAVYLRKTDSLVIPVMALINLVLLVGGKKYAA